jgi:hypothetical protein
MLIIIPITMIVIKTITMMMKRYFAKWDSIQRYGGLSKCFELVQVGRLKELKVV